MPKKYVLTTPEPVGDFGQQIIVTELRVVAFSFRFQKSLTDSLQLKSDTIRGVNLDEELAALIVFEQAYSAAARILSIIQSMFDALERAI